MNLPFTTGEFLEVFQKYNNAVFPAQVIFYLLALSGLYLIVKKHPTATKWNNLFLAFSWLWMGAVYHIGFFSKINGAAFMFGALFIVQSLVLAYYGLVKNEISFDRNNVNSGINNGITATFAWAFIIYGLLIYPVFGYTMGHHYPGAPIFSLPCPTTIYTFGILLLTEKRVPKVVLAIPFLWSLLGFTAAIKLSITEDFGLLLSGIAALTLLIIRDRAKAVETVRV